MKELFDVVSKILVLIVIVKVLLFAAKKFSPATRSLVDNVTPRFDGTSPLQYNVYRL